MKLRHLLACLCLLIGVASLIAVAYLTWQNIVHGDGMILWLYLVPILAGIPLAITWRKDLIATEWAVMVSGVLAVSVLVVGFVMVHGVIDYGSVWHAFMPGAPSPIDPSMTTEDYIRNMPPPEPVWPKITAYLLFMFWGPAFVALVFKGSLFCLRSLRRRAPAAISQ